MHWNNKNKYKTQQKKLRTLTRDPKAQIITSDTSIPWTRSFKPGGTATLINGKVSSHVTHKENDYPMGRWSLIDISQKTQALYMYCIHS